jgi:lipopolysaccharide assembly protein A
MCGVYRLRLPLARNRERATLSRRRGSYRQKMKEAVMRWFYIVVIVLIAAATLLFCVQNRDFATMSFLQFSIRAPLAILALVVYVLGAVTGGSLYALLRKSVRGAKRSDAIR